MTSKLSSLLLLAAISASTQAQTYTTLPIYGCEWVPATTPVQNFTFFFSSGASNSSTTPTSSVGWQVPGLGLSCAKSNPSLGTSFNVRCTPPSDGSAATFKLSPNNGSRRNATATLVFLVWEQCAASIFGFSYQADFPLECSAEGNDADGSSSNYCVPKGNNVSAIFTSAEHYIPTISLPPPKAPPPAM